MKQAEASNISKVPAPPFPCPLSSAALQRHLPPARALIHGMFPFSYHSGRRCNGAASHDAIPVRPVVVNPLAETSLSHGHMRCRRPLSASCVLPPTDSTLFHLSGRPGMFWAYELLKVFSRDVQYSERRPGADRQ